MKILKLQYILILAVLPACQDENFQVPMEENEVHIATENEILLKRGYSDYTLTAERLAGLEAYGHKRALYSCPIPLCEAVSHSPSKWSKILIKRNASAGLTSPTGKVQ